AASMVGTGKLAFVAAGEPFELGFGADDGVRVRRRTTDQRDTTPVVGTQKLTRTVRLYLSNLGGEPKQLLVVERVPVSEIEDVEVELHTDARHSFDAKDGFARFAVELAAGETRELELQIRIKAAAKVQLGL